MEKRDEFNRMMADCRKGKIDRILVKSISRFARNTQDCLTAIRELMRLGVTVLFEENNIDTGMLTNEMLVSISGALAQQESVSISQNIRISYKRRMERGEYITNFAPFGYRLVNKRNLEIDPEEAEIVKWMFESYLNGRSFGWIAKQLTLREVKTHNSNTKWRDGVVKQIILNEKYIGDTLCQKTFRSGFPYIKRLNHGEVDQYYVEGTHPAIIDRETFEAARKLWESRLPRNKTEQRPKALLSQRIICVKCGKAFEKKTKKQKIFWSCKVHLANAANCPVKPIMETEIYAAFVRLYNKLKLHIGTILYPVITQTDELTKAVQRNNPAIMEINKEIAHISEQSHKVSKLQTSGLMDADICTAKIRALNAQLKELRIKRQQLIKQDDINEQIESIRQTIAVIEAGPERLGEFDSALFEELVERIIAESQSRIRFQLYGGLDFAVKLRRPEQW